jgi:OmpA family protein
MKKVLLLPLLAACFAVPAQAQTQGGYIGLGALSASTDNAREFALVFGGTSADKTASGMRVYGGYLWNQYGIEAGYYDLGTYEVKEGALKSDDFKVSAVTVSGVLAIPLGSSVTLNGKLGIAFTSVKYRCYPMVVSCATTPDTTESDIAAIFGAGIGWRPVRNFTLRADLESIGEVSHAAGLNTGLYPYTVLSISGQVNF